MQKFDLIVIGSGSGLDVANAAYQHGLRVAIIEKNRMGGTCLNKGCIPSKLLIHSADVAETIKHAHLFGLKVDGFSVDFPAIVERVNGITDSMSDEIRKSLEGMENPKLFAKECKFVEEKIISIRSGDKNRHGDDSETITADKILIASGSRPRIPRIEGLEGSGYITSDEALRLKKQPKVLTIIGGGYIACELAHFFGALGTKINIIQRRDVLIPDEDKEISKKFTEIFSKKYNVYLDYETEFVSNKDGDSDNDRNSKFQVIAKNTSGKSIEVYSDQLLIAAGRIPNSDKLDLEKTGVKINKKGFVITDRYLETNIKGIFALGDAIGRFLFKHSANHEAQYAYYNLLHPDSMIPVSYHAMPHAIFSSPQVAGVGFTEQEIIKEQEKNNNNSGSIIEYQKSVYHYIDTAMGRALQDQDGFVKFLVDKKDKKILGCHIIGSQASILIHEVLVAMKAGANNNCGTIDNITKTIHIHPSLSEVIARAAGENN
ncbi:MAG: dihydrolipoyl dehydrogenase [Nitrososphaeraceae archaeon]|nr:dihydrolipoyl dehydrogenase [Nitrososphaeraceae archaeon]MBV9666832.1 dihydrolipoyl dehydrogenase [Nitrososphaeraceae archaeon]